MGTYNLHNKKIIKILKSDYVQIPSVLQVQQVHEARLQDHLQPSEQPSPRLQHLHQRVP